MTATLRQCRRCYEDKPLDDFSSNRSRPDGLHTWCRSCCNIYQRRRYHDPSTEWRERRRTSSRKNRLKYLYGIEYDLLMVLYEQQEGCCAICGEAGSAPAQGKTRSVLVVDHDHETGEVRGLLCRRCNTGLGGLGDSVEILVKAASYLLSYHNNIA